MSTEITTAATPPLVLIDSHCHLTPTDWPSAEERSKEKLAELATRNFVLSAAVFPSLLPPPPNNQQAINKSILQSQLCLCGTSPTTDWAVLSAVSEYFENGRSEIGGDEKIEEVEMRGIDGEVITKPVIGFGIHPWWVHEVTTLPWEEQLRSLLDRWPAAIVGEIGLDKARNTEHWELQIDVFQRQMNVAATLRRPVSVHCVRSFGPMLDILRAMDPLPPAVILHGFSGSLDFAKALLKLPKKRGKQFFFGFGIETTAKLKHFPQLCATLPRDRILLESDAFTTEERARNLTGMIGLLATTWGCSPEDVVQNNTVACRLATLLK